MIVVLFLLVLLTGDFVMDRIFLRTGFNYDTREASKAVAFRNQGDSRTKQSFREECDINTIVRRFGLTGRLPEGVRRPTYGDFSNVTDFHSAMNAVAAAHESFDRMPAEVRARFNNDPGAFVDFCSDEKNLDEMRKMGLAVPAKPRPAHDNPEYGPRPTPESAESDAPASPAVAEAVIPAG